MSALDYKRLDALCEHIQVVLITAVEVESRHVRAAIRKNGPFLNLKSRSGANYLVGYMGDFLVAHADTPRLTTGQGGAQASVAVSALINDLRAGARHQHKPLTVILPGIGFGLNRSTQDVTLAKYGEVSDFIWDTLGRINDYPQVKSRHPNLLKDSRQFFDENNGPHDREVNIPSFLTPEEGGTQRIGDVLLSVRIKHGGHHKHASHGMLIDRGEIYSNADLELSRRMKECHKLSEGGFAVHIGDIVSSDDLYSDFIKREELRQELEVQGLDHVVGGEMEGHGAAAFLQTSSVANVVVVKSICDWGVVKGKAKQEDAAANSVAFLQECLSNSGLFEGKIEPASRTEVEDALSSICTMVAPAISQLTPPVPNMVGRQAQKDELTRCILTPAARVVVLRGDRGGGKSEIFRQVLISGGGKISEEIRETFDAVFIVDFAIARNVTSWFKDIETYINRYNTKYGAAYAGPSDIHSGIVEKLIHLVRQSDGDEFLFVFENSEDLIDESSDSDKTITESREAIGRLLKLLIREKIGGLRVLLLCSSATIEDFLPELRNDPLPGSLQSIVIDPLSEEAGLELAANWMEQNKVSELLDGSESERRRFVTCADRLPRLILTLCGMRRQRPDVPLGQFVDDIETLVRNRRSQAGVAGKLSVLLNEQLDRFSHRGLYVITLILAASRSGLTRSELTAAYASVCQMLPGKETLPGNMQLALAELGDLGLATSSGKDGRNKTWRLPNQITDAIELHEMGGHSDRELVKGVYRNVEMVFNRRLDSVQRSFQGVSGAGGLRYEHEGFYVNAAEWMRCMSHIDPAEARIHCLTFLLEAFNWFGQVVPSKAIDVILQSVKGSPVGHAFHALYADFNSLYSIYPKEPIREKSAATFRAAWKVVLRCVEGLDAMLSQDEKALSDDINRQNEALAEVSRYHNRDQIAANKQYLYRIKANASKSRSLLIFYRAEAISYMGAQWDGDPDDPVMLYKLSIERLAGPMIGDATDKRTGVANLQWDVPFVQDALFTHFAVRGKWREALAAMDDERYRKCLASPDREVEGRFFDGLSQLFWSLSQYELAFEAGFYAVLQEYFALFTQLNLMDDYACAVYFMLSERLFDRLRKLHAINAELAEAQAALWRSRWGGPYNVDIKHAGEGSLKGMMSPIAHLLSGEPDEVGARIAHALSHRGDSERDPLYGLTAPELNLADQGTDNKHSNSCNNALAFLQTKVERKLTELISHAHRVTERDSH